MRNTSSVLAIAILLALVFVAPALADDAFIGSEGTPIVFTGTGTGVAQGFGHVDDEPWKGWANVWVYNSSNVAWGDFHFQIFAYWSGVDVSQVDFIAGGAFNPISSQTLGSWVINNTPASGATLDLYFYDDPILPGQSAAFTVYTDNTASHVNFGLMIWPTPVPEPSSMVALSGGLLGMLGYVIRRRR